MFDYFKVGREKMVSCICFLKFFKENVSKKTKINKLFLYIISNLFNVF